MRFGGPEASPHLSAESTREFPYLTLLPLRDRLLDARALTQQIISKQFQCIRITNFYIESKFELFESEAQSADLLY